MLPRLGVTAFVPTIITSPPAVAVRALEVLAGGPPSDWIGARPIGLHLEGPMISPFRRGAHPGEHIVAPSIDLVDLWIEAGPPLMVTLAPELDGSEAAVRRLIEAGVIVAVGHSEADAVTVRRAAGWGIRHGTHLFNAMSGLDHRAPGVAAAILTDERFTTGLIADGIHVAPEMLRLALHIKGPEGLAIVTDATAALGNRPGPHHLGDIEVESDGLIVRDTSGRLAGSAAPITQMLGVMRGLGCEWDDLIWMTSTTPARIVGHEPDSGDQVLLDDDLKVIATAIAGEIVYRREGS
jgi:N-acetylglucosamine-6-phosphate deacetylase